MKKKFGFLRFVAGFYKTVGVIVAVLTVLGAIGILLTSVLGGAALQGFGNNLGLQNATLFGGIFGSVVSAVVILIAGALAAVCQFAVGEAIMVFLSIEENTRATAGLLARQS